MAINEATRKLIYTKDWSATPLGPISTWPTRLRGYVEMILGLPTPAIIFWGPDQHQIYNDGYALIMGPRHPAYFGATYKECWPDTYPLLMPEMRKVLDQGLFFEVLRAPITVTRHGFAEEAFFTFTFSPLVDDEGKIDGVYQPVVEVTELVLRERRAETLRRLTATRDLAAAAKVLDDNRHDAPFVALYVGADRVGDHEPSVDALAAEVLRDGKPREIAMQVPSKIWPEPVTKGVLLPLRGHGSATPFGVVALGASPRLAFDATYRQYFGDVARELEQIIGAALAEKSEKAWRRRETEERERQMRRTAALFELAPVGIAVFAGSAHVYELANAAYVALVPNRPLIGLPIREALPELEGQGIYELLDRVYATGEPYVGRAVSVLMARADGPPEERFFDFVYQPMPNEDGVIDRIIAVVFDISELARAQRAGEAANRAKDHFFAVLGHELRNPLAPIATALELMKMKGDDTFATERAIIDRQVAHIRRLVDDLLDVSRVTGGKVALKQQTLAVDAITRRAVEMVSPLLEQQKHHLVLDVESGCQVVGDEVRLTQVVANLLSNAAKYTEPGGYIAVRARCSGATAVVEIVDNGIGIPEDMLGRIFDPFEQEAQAIDRARGGLGLGLTIASHLVKLHGGTLTAESAGPGKGSTFRIELPLATSTDELRTSSPTPVSPLSATARRVRVLIVDDNVDAALLMAEVVSSLGHEARVAHDGAEALHVVEDFVPDVGLLDIGLPVMDGYELAGRLRATMPPGLRLVAVTGYGQRSDREKALAAGFDAHLVKPVELKTLTELLGEWMNAPSRSMA